MMDTIDMNVSLEDFICRLPAMFPYLEWNADGTVDTHKATDSPTGCYGKIVDNMHIPQGVRLTNYVQVQESDIPSYYEWNNDNTILISEKAKDVFSNSGSAFLRRVLWYVYEKTDVVNPNAVLVDEVPLFVTDDSLENIKTVLTESDGTQIECDGIPLYVGYNKKAHCLYYKREDIISPCKTYSYRTIISEYYKYKDIVGNSNSFIKFVETGIGLIKVNKKLLKVEDEKKYPEVPDSVYLSEVRDMYSVYKEYQTAARYYKLHYIANERTDTVLYGKSEKYTRMGGDNMTNWLAQMIQKAYDVADEYKCHSDNKDFPLSFGANIMLTKHTNVLGLEIPHVNQFVSGNRYYDGDLLTYEGETYVCMLDRFLPNGNNFQYIFKNGKLFELSDGVYIEIDDSNLAYLDSLENATTDFVCYGGFFYRRASGTYVLIDVVSYITGVLDEDKLEYVFDTQHFVPLSEIYGYDEWYDCDNLDGDKYRFFEDVDYLPSTRLGKYVRLNGNMFEWDEDSLQYLAVDDNDFLIKETTNSKLRDIRSFREYVNEFGVAEEPSLNEDWLFFYKVNNISGLMIDTDETGNIIVDDENFVNGGYCYTLHAYGNIIRSISYNQDNNTLSFEYIIGAHLKAKYIPSPDNNSTKRFYSDFEYDETSNEGVRFVETYKCSNDTVASLGSDFEAYVNGEEEIVRQHKYDKFPFITLPETLSDTSVVKGVGTAYFLADNELTHVPVVRKDWMTGLYYQPKTNAKMTIDRGNGASFERHLRLGEVCSMEDLEKYHNGGFYTISES